MCSPAYNEGGNTSESYFRYLMWAFFLNLLSWLTSLYDIHNVYMLRGESFSLKLPLIEILPAGKAEVLLVVDA